MKNKSVLLLLSLLFAAVLGAQDIALSGVDARMMAVTGTVNLYTVVTDEEGRPIDGLTSADFVVRDAEIGRELGEPLPVVSFSPAGDRRDGLAFMMLIDDSGSMYDGPDGTPSPSPDRTRAAWLAVRRAAFWMNWARRWTGRGWPYSAHGIACPPDRGPTVRR
jgi:Ca-activated chloride channel family protein